MTVNLAATHYCHCQMIFRNLCGYSPKIMNDAFILRPNYYVVKIFNAFENFTAKPKSI